MKKCFVVIGCIALAASAFGSATAHACPHNGVDKSALEDRAVSLDEATFSRAEVLWQNEEGDLVTARCTDGTFSRAKHREGACSEHGGVEEFWKE